MEVSILVNADQLQKNRYYVTSLVDIIVFLAENQLPFRGKLKVFVHIKWWQWSFLPLFENNTVSTINYGTVSVAGQSTIRGYIIV